MKALPRNDLVLVRRVRPAEKTESGLYIPDQAQEKKMETRIEAVGPGAFTSAGVRCTAPMSDLKIGMRVMMSKYGGVAVEDQPDLFLVREAEILSILDDADGGEQPKESKR